MKRQRNKLDDAALNALADQLSVLPRDVMRKILKNLSLVEIARLRRMNRRFRETFIDGGDDTSIWIEILNDEAPPDVVRFLMHVFPDDADDGNRAPLIRLMAYRLSTRPTKDNVHGRLWTWKLKNDVVFTVADDCIFGLEDMKVDVSIILEKHVSVDNLSENDEQTFRWIVKEIRQKTGIDTPEAAWCDAAFKLFTFFVEYKDRAHVLLIVLGTLARVLLDRGDQLDTPLNVGTCIQCNAQQAKWREVGNALRVFCSKDCQHAHHIGLGTCN